MELDLEGLQKEYDKLKQEYDGVSKAKQEYDEAIKKAYADPELRGSLKAIMKKVANLELEDPPHEKYMKSEISRVEKELSGLKAEKEKEIKDSYTKQLESVLNQYGISGEEVKKFQNFVSKTGLMPTTVSGWEIAAQNYRRSLVAEPLLGRPKTFKESATSDDYIKNPSGALEKAFFNAMRGGK